MIDSHCHLDFDVYDDRRETVINEALAAGVEIMIDVGVDLASSRRAVKLAEQFEAVYATVGVHPHDAGKVDDNTLQQLQELAAHPRVVAIGEIGLDFYRDLSPRNVQRKVFRRQLELAAEANLPVVIHTRESFEEALLIVGEYAEQLCGGVFHCFPGDADDARRVLELGFVVSVGGIITFKNSGMAGMATAVPLDKIMLETDSPYLAPVPYRGKMNSPAYLIHICRRLAELRGVSSSEIEQSTDRVTRQLFRLEETFEG